MAFRLLVWNIQNFTLKRILNNAGATVAEIADNQQRSLANASYIISTIQEADPDVFVLLEARCGQGNVEGLAAGNGPNGLLVLLVLMKALLSPNWFLVPPLRVNQRSTLADATHTETVGVFWRNDRVNFTGPYVWPAANVNTGPPIAPGGAAAAAYPAPWNLAVPPGTNAAARCRFYRTDGTEIPFCDPQADFVQVARRPFMTTFTELAGQMRNIKLFSVHTKPGTTSQVAMAQMAGMQAADRAPGAGGVTVFAGDFNLNLINRTAMEDTTLDLMSMSQLSLRVPALQNGALAPSRVLPVDASQPNLYHFQQLYDYGFVSYGILPAPPVPQFPAVVADRVVGVAPAALPAFTSDMNLSLANILGLAAANLVNIAAAPHGAVRVADVVTVTTTAAHGLNAGDFIGIANVTDGSFNTLAMVKSVTGATTFTYEQDGLPNATSGTGTVDTQPRLNTFRRRENFGHICQPNSGTSDHLPVFILI